MASVAGIIFANMHDSAITDLTKLRTMGSVPFGARYRLIDFPLSNMVNSGISSVGVITKSNYQSLLDHLGSGEEWDLSRKTGGLRLLPPYGNAANALTSGGLYRGRLEAMGNTIQFIKRTQDKYIVMSDCDVIVNIDYKLVVDEHIKNNADITVVYGNRSHSENNVKDNAIVGVTNKTILKLCPNGRVDEVLIYPFDINAESNTSMNIFVMERQFLLDIIEESMSRNLYSFERDIMQHRCKELKIFGYKYDGYYSQIDSLISYHRCNMELMDFNNRMSVFNPDRPIYTKVKDDAPAKYGWKSCATNSLVSDGCIIEGTVENCVVFRGVKIGEGATVRNSIIMQGSVIGSKCDIDYVIADKNVTVGNSRSLLGTESYPVFVDKGANA